MQHQGISISEKNRFFTVPGNELKTASRWSKTTVIGQRGRMSVTYYRRSVNRVYFQQHVLID